MKNLRYLQKVAILAAFAALSAVSTAQAGYYHEMQNPENTTALVLHTDTDAITCRVLADDITHGRPAYIDCANFSGGVPATVTGATTFTAAGTALAVTNNQTIGGTLAITGATTATGGIVSNVSNDFHTAFSAGIKANPVSMTTKGTCTVASVNADTCVILTGVASRTITVTHFDIVANGGNAGTCTGVLLEDNNGSPVVAATLARATLTSAAHNIPLTATLGVGFGAGTGLTVAKGLQLDVNGSACDTATGFTYTVTYVIQ